MDDKTAVGAPGPESGAKKGLRDEEFWLDLVVGLLARDPPHLVPLDFEDLAEFVAGMLIVQPHLLAPSIALSEEDALTWEVLRSLLRLLLQRPEDFPPVPSQAIGLLKAWGLEVAAGLRPRPPRRKGPDPRVTPFRHSVIAFTVDRIRRLGRYPATTSNESGSACHLVAERLDLNSDSVRKIWAQQKRHYESEAGPPGFVRELGKIIEIFCL